MNRTQLIVAQELRAALENTEVRVLDCRFDLADPGFGRAAHRAGHVPGAAFIDLEEDLSGVSGPMTGRHPLPEPASLAQRLGELGVGNEDTVVVYDADNGGMAARGWWLLRWLGHDKVRLLNGGLRAWLRAGYPLETGEPRIQPRHFAAKPRSELVVETAMLAANVERIAELRLVDARDAARFRGEVEPIDPVAGHIPGARNLPFSSLVQADGTWRDARERRQLLRQLLGDEAEQEAWIAMCGSGVTACHLVLAGVEAGFCEPRLYAGSWSEWIRDASRPRSSRAGSGGDRELRVPGPQKA